MYVVQNYLTTPYHEWFSLLPCISSMCHALRDTEDIWMCEMNDNILLIYVEVVFSSKAKSNSTKQLSIHYNLLILS